MANGLRPRAQTGTRRRCRADSGASAKLAEAFLARAVAGQDVRPGTLNIHADRGTSMTSEGVAELLADLGIGRTIPGRT